MKNKLLLILISLFVFSSLFAQNKELTIEEAVYEQYRKFRPEYLNQIQWKGETNEFVYIKSWKTLISRKIDNTKSEICNVNTINIALSDKGKDKIKYLYGLEWISNNTFIIQRENRIIGYNIETKKIDIYLTIKENAENVSYNKNANSVAYTIENNLFVTDENSKTVQITNDEDKGIVNGNPYVHRQEFGIDNGIFWSPNGKFIAFYRKDETMVADYPIVNFTTRIATHEPIKYPMAGETSEEVTLGVYNIATGKTVFMKTGEPKEQYLTSITWEPSEKNIYIGLLNRDQNHLKLNKYDINSGNFVKTLFEEKHPKYVEPEHQLIFMKTNPSQFLFYSERDNYNHLYLFNTEGKLLKQITKGEWIVNEFLGFDELEENIFIMASKESPIESHLYKVNMKTGQMTKLTKEHGSHSIYLSANTEYFIDEYSNIESSKIIDLCDAKGDILNILLTSENTLKDYNLGEMKIGTFKADDGITDLYYRLITPPNFDPNKKYPAIIYVYGGPHMQLITDSWLGGTRLWQYYMAQKGYVMLSVDNRGSSNRGLEFENIIHRQCGVNEMKDQVKGVEFLAELGYVDMARIGVHGWSYGGFMTSSLLTTYPDVFKVGVAGGPVVDWKYYEVMYGERYMDTPQDNPDGYKETSILNKIGKLQGRLLIIHGGVDPVVVSQNSYDLLLKSIEEDVQIDFFMYPNDEHNVYGRDRIHLMKKVTQYFDDFL